MRSNVPWPPQVGELLPRGAGAVGVHYKLATYSLDMTHRDGGPKAKGFARILGITIEHIDYLEGAIQTGVLAVPVSAVRDKSPWGINCVVMVPVRGLGAKSTRVANIMTAWFLNGPAAIPRLASAFPQP
jgi:hypothetical protein